MSKRHKFMLSAFAAAMVSVTATAAGATAVLTDTLTVYNARGQVKATVSAPANAAGLYSLSPHFGVDTAGMGASSFLTTSSVQSVKDTFGICRCAGANGHHMALAFMIGAGSDAVANGAGSAAASATRTYSLNQYLLPKLQAKGWTAVFTDASPATPTVPEPSAWAMMMIGLGMAGGALRRRARVSASA